MDSRVRAWPTCRMEDAPADPCMPSRGRLWFQRWFSQQHEEARALEADARAARRRVGRGSASASPPAGAATPVTLSRANWGSRAGIASGTPCSDTPMAGIVATIPPRRVPRRQHPVPFARLRADGRLTRRHAAPHPCRATNGRVGRVRGKSSRSDGTRRSPLPDPEAEQTAAGPRPLPGGTRPRLHSPHDRTPFARPPLMRVQPVVPPCVARRRQPGRASRGCCAGASCCTRSASPRSAPAPRAGCRTARRPGTHRATGR